MQKIFDISPPLAETTAVWPGDTPLSRQINCRLAAGDTVDLSSVNTTVHIGAHADAPSHYKSDAPTIDQIDLSPYLGPCRVITVTRRPLILADDCAAALGATRVLFRTNSQPDPARFPTDFTAFAPEAIAFLGRAGVLLVGIDTASVDPFASKALPAHQELWRWGIRNLEGLDLSGVPDGDYELIALPLKLVGFDASPVRAILRVV